MALVCIEDEELGRHFGSWQQIDIDDPKGVFRKVREADKMVTIDLAEPFLASWEYLGAMGLKAGADYLSRISLVIS